jgi:hypothetical protein
MRDVLPELALVGILVLVNAAFAGTELALVSLREGQLQRLERRSRAGAVLAEIDHHTITRVRAVVDAPDIRIDRAGADQRPPADDEPGDPSN